MSNEIFDFDDYQILKIITKRCKFTLSPGSVCLSCSYYAHFTCVRLKFSNTLTWSKDTISCWRCLYESTSRFSWWILILNVFGAISTRDALSVVARWNCSAVCTHDDNFYENEAKDEIKKRNMHTQEQKKKHEKNVKKILLLWFLKAERESITTNRKVQQKQQQ